MSRTSKTSRRAFAIRELVALTAAASVTLALLIPLRALASGTDRLSVCISRMWSLGSSNAKFANDHQDRIASLRSKLNQSVTYQNPGLGRTYTYGFDFDAETQSVRDEVIDIIIRRGNRRDITRVTESWLPMVWMSHLAIAEYDRDALPSARYACPEDSVLLKWQERPLSFHRISGVPSPVESWNELSNLDKRWPYVSSYTMGTCSWSNDINTANSGAYVFLDATSIQRRGPVSAQGDVGYRRMSEVRDPSRKVHMWDRGARHSVKKPVYWNYDGVKQPLLCFDGSVVSKLTSQTLPGWNWYQPTNANSTYDYTYTMDSQRQWLPGLLNGQPAGSQRFTAAYFATTRNGLQGRDW